MQYIHLNNNTFIMHTPSGSEQITRKSFNFHKIIKAVKAGATFEDIKDFLIPPDTSKGILELYKVKGEHKLITKKYANDDNCYEYEAMNGTSISKYDINNLDFIGVYISMNDILYDWPEYGM